MFVLNPYAFGSTVTGIKVGLQSWWDLDEASGNRADAHGTRTMFEHPGSISSVAARVGNGSNAASGQYLQTNAPAAPSPSIATGDFTIAGVFKTSNSQYGIISRNGSSAGSDRQFFVNLDNPTGTAYFAVSTNGTSNAALVTGPAGLNDGNLHDYIAWRDTAGNTINLQIDGGTVFSATFSGATAIYSTTDPGIILHGIGSSTYVTGGVADATGIWNRMLTSTERTNLRNGGAWRSYAGLAGI